MTGVEAALYAGVLFIFGAILGSFLNVVGLRVPQGRSFTSTERSGCPACGHTLRWYELIPVVSYVVQGGKCRGCKDKISIQYPLVELITGALFALAFIQFGLTAELFVALTLVSMLVVVFVADIKYLVIPNGVLLAFLPLLAIGRTVAPLDPWYSPLLAGLIGFVGIFIIIMASGGGMGGGDMKLFAVLGVALGIGPLLLTFFLSVVIGLGVGLILMTTGRVRRGVPFPFGPSIVVAALIAYFGGGPMIDWYLGLLQ